MSGAIARLAASLLASAVLACSAAEPVPIDALAKGSAEKSKALDAELGTFFQAKDPGGAVIITQRGRVVFRKAWGMADLERKVKLAPETAFRIGSITKQFTAVAILMLDQEGKVSLSDDIVRWFPEIPPAERPTTIEHLLTHRSGLPSYTAQADYWKNRHRAASPTEIIALFRDKPRAFAPGDGVQYSNSNYYLLGLVVEKVSGMSLADFLAQRIFTPIGMTSTAIEGAERNGTLRAEGYAYTAGSGFRKADSISNDWPQGAGGIVSTVDDLARWNNAISTGKLLDERHWKLAFTPGNGWEAGYAFGWQVEKTNGWNSRRHGGAIEGFSSAAAWLHEQDVYVAVLLNLERPAATPNLILLRAISVYLGSGS